MLIREIDPYKSHKVKLIIYMVTPYMDHDLSGLLENPNVKFTEPQIKCYMYQLLEGTKYLHEVGQPPIPGCTVLTVS